MNRDRTRGQGQLREYDERRFNDFVGPFLLAGFLLFVRLGLAAWFPFLKSELMYNDQSWSLHGYFFASGRWWTTLAVMAFAGLAGYLFGGAREAWFTYQAWVGRVIEQLVGSLVFGAVAIYGAVRFF